MTVGLCRLGKRHIDGTKTLFGSLSKASTEERPLSQYTMQRFFQNRSLFFAKG